MNHLQEQLLSLFQLDEEGYARLIAPPSFSDIPTLENDDGAKRILARLEKARAEGEPILIYGDYDCDGVMATSIMKLVLEEFGLSVSTYLPSRYLDGYGLNASNAKKIAEKNHSLVLLVDNGVSAHEGIRILNEHGIDVLIIDHHEIPSMLPENAGIIHPETSHYPAPDVSAGYLCFLFSTLLLSRVDSYLLTLGALSTIGDMMPLKDHNRTIVRLALESIQRDSYPQIVHFLAKEEISADDLGMSFIPAINAIGRLEEGSTINRLVRYFASPYGGESEKIGQWMKAVNEERKAMTARASDGLSIAEEERIIFLESSLKEGVNGLLANRLIQKYRKPVLVYSPKAGDPSLLVGSFRSLPTFYVSEALEAISSYLVAGGGHPLAGGLSIKRKDLPIVKKLLDEYASCHPLVEAKGGEIEIHEEDLTMENLQFIESLAPFGQEWKRPIFVLKDLDVSSFGYAKGGKYLSFPLSNGVRVFSFSLSSSHLPTSGKVNLAGEVRGSTFRGQKRVEFLAKEIA